MTRPRKPLDIPTLRLIARRHRKKERYWQALADNELRPDWKRAYEFRADRFRCSAYYLTALADDERFRQAGKKWAKK